MLKTIIAGMNGSGGDPAALGSMLEQLKRDQVETRASIEALEKDRHQALLDDAEDAAIDKIERKIDRAIVRLEKLVAAEAPLREQLVAAVANHRSEARDKHLAEIARLVPHLVTAARETVRIFSRYIEAIDAMRAGGFEPEIAAFVAAPPALNYNFLCAPDLIDRFEAEALRLEEAAKGSSRRPAPVRVIIPPAAPARRPRSGDNPRSHAVRLYEPAEPQIQRSRNPDDFAPLEPDQVRARVLLAGYSPADNLPQCDAGQIIRVPRVKALRAAAMGRLQILEEGAAP